LRKEVGRHLGRFQPEQVLHLRQRDQHGNAVGEADDDGHRHIAHQPAQPEQAHQEQQHPGHGRADQQVGQAIALEDAVDDDDEGPGRPADLHARPAQGRDQQPGNDGRDQPLLGLDPRGDGKGHGQRQRHHAHGDACANVGQCARARVAAQVVQQTGTEAVQLRQGWHAIDDAPGWLCSLAPG
jgi:hypothetical protein